MAVNNHFYVTLPSNASMDIYPENTMTTFRVKLPEKIQLTGHWEVGMSDLIYSQTFVLPAYSLTIRKITLKTDDYETGNVSEECEGTIDAPRDKPRTIRISCPTDEGTVMSSFEKEITTTSTYFETAADFVAHLNQLVQQEEEQDNQPLDIRFNLNRDTQFVTMTLGSRTSVTANSQLLHILGFRGNQVENGYFVASTDKTIAFTGVVPSSISTLNTIYVYIDIINMGIVGDTTARLLDIVPVDYKVRGMTAHRVERPRYKPLERRMISEVLVHLRDNEGQFIRFLEGTVVLKLHFRKRG